MRHILTKQDEGIRLDADRVSAGDPLPARHPNFTLRVLADGTSIACHAYAYTGAHRRFNEPERRTMAMLGLGAISRSIAGALKPSSTSDAASSSTKSP